MDYSPDTRVVAVAAIWVEWQGCYFQGEFPVNQLTLRDQALLWRNHLIDHLLDPV